MFLKYQKLKVKRERSHNPLLVYFVGEYIGLKEYSSIHNQIAITKYLCIPLEENDYYRGIIHIEPKDIVEIINGID
jgi:hypothetical protein